MESHYSLSSAVAARRAARAPRPRCVGAAGVARIMPIRSRVIVAAASLAKKSPAPSAMLRRLACLLQVLAQPRCASIAINDRHDASGGITEEVFHV